MANILIPSVLPGGYLSYLRNIGHNLMLPRNGVQMPRLEALEKIADCEGLFGAGVDMGREIIEAGKSLKVIACCGAGYDNVDLEAATERGIVVCNAPDETTEATADVAFALMLDVMRGVNYFDNLMRIDTERAFQFSKAMYGMPPQGKTLGILGMGRIGKAIMRRAIAFGMEVFYHNRNELNDVPEARYVAFDDLFRLSDVISVNTPLNDNTRHLIGSREIGLMKESAYLVNVSRGAVIDEDALIDALIERRIAGAGLDVYENEPEVPAALLQLDNVVLTPHIGTATEESRARMAMDAAGHLAAFFEGAKMAHVVNPEVYEVAGKS